jgi:hypothetical protein
MGSIRSPRQRSKQFARNDKPKLFRGPQIDGERERGRLLHRQDYADHQGNYSRVLLSAEWGSGGLMLWLGSEFS